MRFPGSGGGLGAAGAAGESSPMPCLSLLYPSKALLYGACFFLGNRSFGVMVQSALPLQWSLEEVCIPIKWKGLGFFVVFFLILKSVVFTPNNYTAPVLVQPLIFVENSKAKEKLFYLGRGLDMLNTAFYCWILLSSLNLDLPLDASMSFPTRLKPALWLETSFLCNNLNVANKSPLSSLG